MANLNSLNELETKGKVGDWVFIRQDTYIAIKYDESDFGITILPILENPAGQNAWGWNGNKELPTLSPSILIHEKPGAVKGWHGFLRDGVLIIA